MDKATLVATDLAVGSTIVNLLENAGLRLSVAMWLHTPEYEDPRFVLSSRDLDGPDRFAAYGLIHDTLEKAGFPPEHTPPLLIFRTSELFVQALRRMLRKARNVEGMRLGGQMIGDRFIEDAIVYRVR